MISPSFKEEDTRQFYKFIGHRSGEYTELRIFDPVLVDAPPKKRAWVSTEKDFVETCRKWCDGYHVYAGVNPRKNNLGGSIEDISRISCIPWDIDSDHPKNSPATDEEKSQARQLLYDFLKWNKEQGYNDPYIDDSGNGFHVINRVNISFEDHKQIDRKLKNFFKQAKAVFPTLDNISDLPRIIRVPGTWNIKGTQTEERPHRQARILQTGTMEKDRKLEEHILSLTFPIIPDKKKPKKEIKSPEKLDPNKIKLLRRCQQKFLEEGGRLSPKGDRNAETGLRMNLVRSMHITGFTKDEILIACKKFEDYNPEKSILEVNRVFEEIESSKQTATEWYCDAILRNEGCLGPQCQDYKSSIKYAHIDPLNFFILTRQGNPKSFVPRRMADAIMKIHKFLATSEKSAIWIYNEEKGIWEDNGTEIIQNTVTEWLKQFYQQSYVNSTLTNIRYRNYRNIDILGGPPEKIVMKNGIYNLLTDEFTDFDPYLYAIAAVPVVYDPNVKCPKIEKFLSEIAHPEDVPKLIEYPGYCLYKATPIHRVLILVGGGNNGKSTYLRLIESFLGHKNVSHVTMQNIAEGGFKVEKLFGKLANICADIPSKPIKETGTLKMLTGDDYVTIERKYHDPFDYLNYAKPSFSANKVPASWDDTIAYHRRIVLVPFDAEFPKENPKTDINLLEKLTSPEELSGFFNLTVMGLKEFLRQKGFSNEPSAQKRRMEYIRRSDPVQYFAIKFVERAPDQWLTKAQLYDHYVHMCKILGVTPIANTWFSRNVRRFLPYVYEGDERIDGLKTKVWRGIRVKMAELNAESGTAGTVGTAFPIVSPIRIDDYTGIERGIEYAAPAVPTVPKEESPPVEEESNKTIENKTGNTVPVVPETADRGISHVIKIKPMLQEKLSAMLAALKVVEGMTLSEAASRFGMEEGEAKKLLFLLKRDGLAFSPRIDFWRAT